jgi:hypothetical protein
VLDLLRDVRAPMSPAAVTAKFAEDLKSYGVHRVVADRWGTRWVEERFRCEGITCDQSADPKSIIYASFLPLLNSGRIKLLDNQRLINQLIGLEWRTARDGRDTIDHTPGAHDDLINAAAGCLTLPATRLNKAFVLPLRGGF